LPGGSWWLWYNYLDTGKLKKTRISFTPSLAPAKRAPDEEKIFICAEEPFADHPKTE
jgi:hypothetical protein